MAIIVTLPGTQKYLGISSMVVGGKKLFQSPVPPTYCTSFIVNKYIIDQTTFLLFLAR